VKESVEAQDGSNCSGQSNTRHTTDGWDGWSLFAIPSQQYSDCFGYCSIVLVCLPLFLKDIGIQDDDPWDRMASAEQGQECDAHNIFHFCSQQQVLHLIQGWVQCWMEDSRMLCVE